MFWKNWEETLRNAMKAVEIYIIRNKYNIIVAYEIYILNV